MPDNNNPKSGSPLVSDKQKDEWRKAIYDDLNRRSHPIPDDEKDAYADAYVRARSEGKNRQDAMNEGQKERTKKRKEKKEEEKKRIEEEEEREKENNRKANSEFYQASMPDDIGVSFPPKPSSSEIEAKETNISDESESQNISKKIYISLVYSICPKDKMLPKTDDYERINKCLESKLDSFQLYPMCNFESIEGSQSSPDADDDAYIYIDCSSLSLRELCYELIVNDLLKKKLIEGLDGVFRAYMSMSNMLREDCKLYLTVSANEAIIDMAYASIYAILGVSASRYKCKVKHKSLIKHVENHYLFNNFSEIRNRGNVLTLYALSKVNWFNSWIQMSQAYLLQTQKSSARKAWEKVSTGIHLVLGVAGALIPHPLVKAIVVLTDLAIYEVETIVYWKLGDKRAAVNSFKGFEFSLAFALFPVPYKATKEGVKKAKVIFTNARILQQELKGLGRTLSEIREAQKLNIAKRMYLVTELEEKKAQALAAAEAKQARYAASIQQTRAELDAASEAAQKGLRETEEKLLQLEHMPPSEMTNDEMLKTLNEYQKYKEASIFADIDKAKFAKAHPTTNHLAVPDAKMMKFDPELIEMQKQINILTIQIVFQELAIRYLAKTVTFNALRNTSLRVLGEYFQIIKESGKATAYSRAYDISSVVMSNIDNFLDEPLILVDMDTEDKVENLKNGRELIAYSTWELKEDMYHLIGYAGQVWDLIKKRHNDSKDLPYDQRHNHNTDFIWDINGA